MCLLFTKYMTPGNWLSQCHCWIWAINPACNRNRLKSLVEWHCKARSWRLPVLQEVGGIQNSNLMSRKSIAFEIAPKSLTWCNVSDSLRKNGAGVCEHQCNCLPLFQNHSPSFERSILQNKHLWASMPLTWGVFCIFTVCNMWTICKTTLAGCTTKEQNDQSAKPPILETSQE